jgi:hypothetical protein
VWSFLDPATKTYCPLTKEAKVSGRADEERAAEVVGRQLPHVVGQADPAAGDRRGAPEAEQPVEVEGRDLGRVPLEVGEVVVVRPCRLQNYVMEPIL